MTATPSWVSTLIRVCDIETVRPASPTPGPCCLVGSVSSAAITPRAHHLPVLSRKRLCCAPDPPPTVQLATALAFFKDDSVSTQPNWVGKQNGCKDSVPVDLYKVGETIPGLDECAEKCQKQPGCYLFSYSVTTDGAKTPESCQWHKTTSWGRCDNVDSSKGNNVELFRLRMGACVRQRISSMQ